MPEHPATDLSATDNIGTVKRYAPPNQRNRSLGRRKSGGDRLERANSYASDGEKNQISVSSSVSTVADASGVNRANEYPPTRLIPLQGCGTSEAFQLLNDRWAAALNAHNNLPDDSLERPVMYTKRSPWGHAILPHQLMSQAGAGSGSSTGPHKDFLSELRLAMLSANAISDA